MAIVALYHLGGGAWGFGIRRPLEAGMMTIPLLALLFVPLLVQGKPRGALRPLAAAPTRYYQPPQSLPRCQGCRHTASYA